MQLDVRRTLRNKPVMVQNLLRQWATRKLLDRKIPNPAPPNEMERALREALEEWEACMVSVRMKAPEATETEVAGCVASLLRKRGSILLWEVNK